MNEMFFLIVETNYYKMAVLRSITTKRASWNGIQKISEAVGCMHLIVL